MKPWLFFAAGLLAALPAMADVVVAKNGQILEGKITRESDKEIAINAEGVELVMNRSEIASVVKKPLPKKMVVSPGGPAKTLAGAPSAKPPAAPDTSVAGGQEFPILVFDQRGWQLGMQGSDEKGKTAVFLLQGESTESWTELVTVQMIPGMQSRAMPVDFAYYAKNDLLKLCPSVDWKLLGASQNEAMFEWSVQGCAAQPDQAEIVRVVRGQLGMHLIHYAARKPKIAAEERLKWIERLGRAKLVKK